MPATDSQAKESAALRSLPPVLLTDSESAALFGVSVRTFHALRDESWMPKPIELGPRLLRWSRAELEDAVAAMPRQSGRSEPAALARSRIDRMKRGGGVAGRGAA